MSFNCIELENMIMSFRVSDLKILLSCFGLKLNGPKMTLQKRALELLNNPSFTLVTTIRKLYEEYCKASSIGSNVGITASSLLSASNTIVKNIKKINASRSANETPGCSQTLNDEVIANNTFQSVTQASKSSQQCFEKNFSAFHNLPFYDVITALSNQTLLINPGFKERNILFYLGPVEFKKMDKDKRLQVLLYLWTDQRDRQEFPLSLTALVNNQLVASINFQSKKNLINSPFNITRMITMEQPQLVRFIWDGSITKTFNVAVLLARKLSCNALIQNLKNRTVSDPANKSAMVKDTFNTDSEVKLLNTKTSLLCPLTKAKMILPCRSRKCKHYQCFDAAAYIKMNHIKPKWICPICNRSAEYRDLIIDEFVLDILRNTSFDGTEDSFIEEVNKTTVDSTERPNETSLLCTSKQAVPKRRKNVEVINIDSDDEEYPNFVQPPPKKQCYSGYTPLSNVLSQTVVREQNSQSCTGHSFQCSSRVSTLPSNQKEIITPSTSRPLNVARISCSGCSYPT